MKLERFGLGIAKGLTVTIRHLFRHPTVSQYPEQKLNVSQRTRGNELVWSRNNCTGCATCAKACHIGAIHIETSPVLVDNRYEVKKYRVDMGYCIFCGLCVEACPFYALFMGTGFERARYRRGDIIFNKEDMMLENGERKPSAYFYPELAVGLPKQTLLLEKITESKNGSSN